MCSGWHLWIQTNAAATATAEAATAAAAAAATTDATADANKLRLATIDPGKLEHKEFLWYINNNN